MMNECRPKGSPLPCHADFLTWRRARYVRVDVGPPLENQSQGWEKSQVEALPGRLTVCKGFARQEHSMEKYLKSTYIVLLDDNQEFIVLSSVHGGHKAADPYTKNARNGTPTAAYARCNCCDKTTERRLASIVASGAPASRCTCIQQSPSNILVPGVRCEYERIPTVTTKPHDGF